MKKVLLIIIMLFVISGCDKEIKPTEETAQPVNKEKLYKESIKDTNVETLIKKVVNSDLYSNNSKLYYDQLKDIYIKNNNEYASRFISEYKKIDYDSLSNLEKNIFDCEFRESFDVKEIVKKIEIKNVWQIGFDDFKEDSLDKNVSGLFIEYFITKSDAHDENAVEETYTLYDFYRVYIDQKTNKLETVNKIFPSDGFLPVNVKKAKGKVDYNLNKNSLYYKYFVVFDKKEYKKVDDEIINNLNTKVQSTMDVLTTYFYDRQTMISSKEFDNNPKVSGSCDSATKAESAIRIEFQNQLSSVKGKFKKIISCEITNITKKGEYSDHFSYIVNGTCKGYTDNYDQNYNIATFDLDLSVYRNNCGVFGSAKNIKMRY